MSEVNFKLAVDNCTDKSSELINSFDLEQGLLWASEKIAELEDTVEFQNSESKRKAIDSKARIAELEKTIESIDVWCSGELNYELIESSIIDEAPAAFKVLESVLYPD